MKRSRSALGAALVLLTVECADAAYFPRAISGKGYLAVPVGTVDRPKKHTKRQSDGDGKAFEQTLDNRDFFYSADVVIGNPGQTVTVLVDTGSSELWVNPECNTVPNPDQAEQCESFGQYDPSRSEDAVGPFGSEEINYGDPTDPSTLTSVNIRYYADDIAFGDAVITNQTFGVVATSDGQSQGIMGLAPDLTTGFDGGDDPYSLVLNSMFDQGIINSRIFALDLRHAESSTGAVIYGGLDRNKFIGTLEERPIIRGEQGEFRLATSLSSMGITTDESQNYVLGSDDRNVMLDSGTTLSRMHYSAAYPILDALSAQDDGEGYYVTLCSYREQPGSVDFTFGNKTVRVPLRDFIIDLGSPTYCYVGLVITTDQQILGDSVLRAGYFVFDWDNEAVHVGQAANCGDSDIVAVGSGADAVPDVTGNCDESDAVFTGGSFEPTSTISNSLPTQAYTTVYTITTCPGFDQQCSTGAITTQTIEAAGTNPTGSSSGDDSGSDSGTEEDAGVRAGVVTGMVVAFGILAGAFNVW